MSSIRKRILCALTALAAAAALSGCSGVQNEERPESPTLAPAAVKWEAPDGDRSVRQGKDYLIYIPGLNELQLTPRTVHPAQGNLIDTAKYLTEQLLAEINAQGGTDRNLALMRGRPVEISGDICTINLDSSALRMNYSDYYKLCVALATTLCGIEEINWVNVLTADQSVGLDITGSLAMGTLTGHPDENLPVLWEQMEAKRTPLGKNLSGTPMSAQATIYYPLTEGQGIGCESLLMNFPGQDSGQLASALLSALNDIARRRAGGAALPDLAAYLLHDPLTSELEDGGKMITISFRENISELLGKWDTDLPCLIAACSCTLTTFIPGVTSVCVRIGEKPVTELSNERYSAGTLLSGQVRRSAAEQFLTGSAVVFLEKDGKLVRCEKPVERQMSDSPRELLRVLMEGPDRKEAENGIRAALPEAVREEDILGISAEGDTLLVNLSEVVRSEIRSWGAEKEALLCYSMVNTLCLNTGLKRVCFFFEGEQAETIAGEIYWAGEFMYNPEL